MLEISFQPYPALVTERLCLRQIVEADKHEIFALRSDAEAMRYINKPLMQTLAEAEKHIEMITELLNENSGINWGITLKGEVKIIGSVVLFHFKPEHYRAEIGYMLHPKYHRKGIMQEALQPVIKYAFDVLKLHSLEAIVNPDNEASTGILLKNKFKREAYFREDFFWEEKFLDSAVYSLLTHER